MIDIRSQAECERREVAESAGYPQVRVEICFDNQQIVLETTSNHVHLLPWTIHAAEEVESFNPAISKSLALMMPAKFLFRERLLTGENMWQAESEM